MNNIEKIVMEEIASYQTTEKCYEIEYVDLYFNSGFMKPCIKTIVLSRRIFHKNNKKSGWTSDELDGMWEKILLETDEISLDCINSDADMMDIHSCSGDCLRDDDDNDTFVQTHHTCIVSCKLIN
jgi:hypothetical protein